MQDFKTKMHKIKLDFWWAPQTRFRPCWGSLQHSPDALVGAEGFGKPLPKTRISLDSYSGLVLPAPAVPRRVLALETDLGVVPVFFRGRCQASPARLRPGGPDTINVRRMSAHGPDSFLWPSTPCLLYTSPSPRDS